MRKKWVPVWVGMCALLSACGQKDGKETVIGITETAAAYESMPYGEFVEQTGNEAEFYHGDRFIGEIPGSSLCVIYEGEYDEDMAGAVLADEDMPIRLQGPLGDLLDGVRGEMSPAEFSRALSAGDAEEAVCELLEGGGTAYYIGNEYARISFDSDQDGECDRLLFVSMDEVAGEKIGPQSTAWLEMQ